MIKTFNKFFLTKQREASENFLIFCLLQTYEMLLIYTYPPKNAHVGLEDIPKNLDSLLDPT